MIVQWWNYQWDPVTCYIQVGHTSADEQSPPNLAPNAMQFPYQLMALVSGIYPQPAGDPKTTSLNIPVQGGWKFVLDDDGKPEVDANGHPIITYPPFASPQPATEDYIILGQLNSNALPIEALTTEKVLELNYKFLAAGKPALPGTSHLPVPTFDAVILPAAE